MWQWALALLDACAEQPDAWLDCQKSHTLPKTFLFGDHFGSKFFGKRLAERISRSEDVIAYSSVISALDGSSMWLEALQLLETMEADLRSRY